MNISVAPAVWFLLILSFDTSAWATGPSDSATLDALNQTQQLLNLVTAQQKALESSSKPNSLGNTQPLPTVGLLETRSPASVSSSGLSNGKRVSIGAEYVDPEKIKNVLLQFKDVPVQLEPQLNPAEREKLKQIGKQIQSLTPDLYSPESSLK
jgi:hypothetical protein